MRKDMFKIIVERPRRGGKADRPGRERPLDDLPAKQGMRRPHREGSAWKELNENLRPLERFLQSNVGRPWDKVYSEISRELDPGNAVKQHVRDHIEDFVTLKTVLHPDGSITNIPKYGWYSPLVPGKLYVHPVSGLLLIYQPKRVRTRKSTPTQRDKEFAEISKALTTFAPIASAIRVLPSGRVVIVTPAGVERTATKRDAQHAFECWVVADWPGLEALIIGKARETRFGRTSFRSFTRTPIGEYILNSKSAYCREFVRLAQEEESRRYEAAAAAKRYMRQLELEERRRLRRG